MNRWIWIVALVVTVSGGLMLVCATPADAQLAIDKLYDGQWRFTLAPYLFLPNINGTFRYNLPDGGGGSFDVKVGPSDYLTNLSFAFAGYFEARKGNWALFTDVIYLNFTEQSASVITADRLPADPSFNVGTDARLVGVQWSLGGAYTVARSEAGTLDVLGGFRYLGLDTTVNWSLKGPLGRLPLSGTISSRQDIWDAIVGVKGHLRLGSGPWFAPYYLDVGLGSSTFTWQGVVGVGYAFGWGDIVLSYRYLYLDMEDTKLLQAVSFGGPMLAVNFRW